MIERYSRPEMARVWSEEGKLDRWLQVEVAVCEASAEQGAIPADAAEKIRRARYDKAAIDRYFAETQHDMVAFLRSVADSLGSEGRFVHLGLTSYDVQDTAMALQIAEAADIFQRDLSALREVLETRALEHKDTLMMGRTHGVHAEPISFGQKLAGWADEGRRQAARLAEATAPGPAGQNT